MEVSEYLKIAKRHWKLIALLLVAALTAVYWTSPTRVAPSYEATHTLLVESTGSGRGSATEANPEVLALWATVGDVPSGVAETVGDGTSPERLANQVTIEADGRLGTLAITASDKDPERAELIANTFATELIEFVGGREAQRVAEATAANAAREQDLRNRIATLDASIAAAPPNVETLTAERDALIRQLGDVLERTEAAAAPAVITTLEPATAAQELEGLPGTRNRTQRMVLAGLVALVLGFGLAVVLDRSDTRIRTRREAEQAFRLPVIAEIPVLFINDRRRKLMVHEDPDGLRAEAYRTLRASIMLYRRYQMAPSTNGGPDKRQPSERGVVMVTSHGAREGKSSTVANLAVAYAETGQSVLVLSCDMWRSGVAERFGVSARQGIGDYLSATEPVLLEAFVYKTDVPGVSVVPAGHGLRRPGGRLLAEQRLVQEARALADVVLLDTAPLAATSLTRELATMVDAVVVACRIGHTTVSAAENLAELLEQLDAPALGVVLLGVPTRPFSGYMPYGQPRRGRRGRSTEPAEEASPIFTDVAPAGTGQATLGATAPKAEGS